MCIIKIVGGIFGVKENFQQNFICEKLFVLLNYVLLKFTNHSAVLSAVKLYSGYVHYFSAFSFLSSQKLQRFYGLLKNIVRRLTAAT